MTASIYLVRKHGKPVYVGFTRRPIEVRWNDHCKTAKKGSTYALHCAIRKYHTDAFTVDCLYESEDIEHIKNCMEPHYIWLYQTFCNMKKGGYNMTMGGDGIIGYKHSIETLEKMSAAHVGRVYSLTGVKTQPLSEDTKKKISIALTGKPRSDEACRAISKSATGRKHTEETKAKIRAARLKQLCPRSGKKHTEETKAKISQSKKHR